MRRLLLPALAVLILSAAGCGPGPATSPPTPSPARGGSSSAPSPAPSTSPAASLPPGTSPAASPAPSSSAADPEHPRDPIGPPVVLTGTVGRVHGCVVLSSGGHRWALIGRTASRLADGQQVTVRGRPVAVPAGCAADFAVVVRPAIGK